MKAAPPQSRRNPAAAGAARPWYREPWTWGLIAPPALAVLAGFVTLGLAIRSDDGLVAEDYYRQGLAINRVLARERRAEELGLGAQLDLSGRRVRVRLHGAVAEPSQLRLRLVHPTRGGRDAQANLRRVATGLYLGELDAKPDPVGAGRREVILEDTGQTWRLRGAIVASDASAASGAAGARARELRGLPQGAAGD